jgi:lipopolysaccharide transport system ATP-binding protein
MKVRLGFAIAAHLEPDILIVDEVLAVGDVAFQKKCLGKMGDVTAEGRTVLFVSHNMSLVRALCRRGILLERGAVIADAGIDDVVAVYLRRLEDVGAEDLSTRTDRRGWREIIVTRIDVLGSNGAIGRLVTGSPARFVIHLSATFSRMICTFTIFNQFGNAIVTFSSAPETSHDDLDIATATSFECAVDEFPLVPGRYRIDVFLHAKGQLQDRVEGAAFFEVEDGPFRGRPIAVGSQGDVVVPHRWRTSSSS